MRKSTPWISTLIIMVFLAGLGVSVAVAATAGWLVSARAAKTCVMDALRQP